MNIDMSQFYQVFFDESAEHLAEMERLLLAMDVDNPDIEEMNAIFRAAHSIKGGSGTFGFTDMTEVTHVLENLLDRLRKREMAPRAMMIDVFLEAADVLKAQLECHREGIICNADAATAVCEKLRSLSEDDMQALPAPAATSTTENTTPLIDVAALSSSSVHCYEILFKPGKKFLKRDNALEQLQAELASLGSLEVTPEPADTSHRKKSKKGKANKKLPSGRTWRFHLQANAKPEALHNLLAFVAAPEEFDISISTEGIAPSNDAGDASFGLFDSQPAAGKGPTASDSSAATQDQDYGFFTELPVEQPSSTENAYGFFEPLPPVAAAPQVLRGKGSTSADMSSKPRDQQTATGETSIRVSVERVDQLINLVGELVITQAMLTQTAAEVDPVLYEKLHGGLAQLERNTRDLQESVMSIRMMPISFVFSRFPRLVRDLAAKLDKQVELVTIGETTELDKSLIEKIADPLTHLVRNSLDHGIESMSKRQNSGKPAKGTITLAASHQGGNVVIEVSDDGAGLNREKILAKAVERGLSVSDAMTDNDVWMLIFEPGFSTADVVTDVSGRGVGMDVVKRNITEMGGVVNINSSPGVGTSITIRLPLTLAILDGMSVALGANTYVIPLNMILETMQPLPQDIKTVTGQGHMVQVRGEYLPIIALHKIFNSPTSTTDPCQGVLVLIEAEDRKAALFVDALLGQQQVVIKSLETNFRKINGVSGATIMGDGTVALILDVQTLIRIGQ